MPGYLPLTLKFRPQNFSDLIGQEATIRILTNMLVRKRIHPSLIFSGSRGTGKTTTARIIAKALNCKNPKNGSEPCNECDSCLDILSDKSMSVWEYDGASHGSVDDIRKIKEELLYADLGGGYRVYVIDEAHSLSSKAWDAFLKLLEEPPPNVIFVFCTTEVHKIPETIVSRSQPFSFTRITNEYIQKRLKYICELEKIDVDDGVLEGISYVVNGGMRDAISLLDQLVSFSSDQKITVDHLRQVIGAVNVNSLFDIAGSLFKCDLPSLFKTLQKVYHEVSDVASVVDDLIRFYRDAMFVKIDIGVQDSQKQYVERLALFVTPVPIDYLSSCQQYLMSIAEGMRRGRLPARVVLDVGITKLLYGGVSRSEAAQAWQPPQTVKQRTLPVDDALSPDQVAGLIDGSILQI